MDTRKKIAVIGIGNVLMGDDGFGPYVIKRLEAAYRFPEQVSLIEAGTPGMDLTSLFCGLNAIVMVDTVRVSGRAPGEIWKFDKEEILKGNPAIAMTAHDPGLREALLTLQITGEEPEKVLLIGIIAENVELGLDLSNPVQKAVPEVMREVRSELERLGVKVEDKVPPDALDIWWLRDAV